MRIEKGMTTFTVHGRDRRSRYVDLPQPEVHADDGGIQMDVQEWADSNVIGLLPVNNKTRDFVLGDMPGASGGARGRLR